jgi:amino acid adenylation domain-containing protein
MSSEWTAAQQAYLAEFIQQVLARTPKSKQFTADHRPHFADPRAVSGFKTAWKEITYPLVGERSKGSRMWDIDGNEYIDCAGGFGATFFGHAPDFIVDALKLQLDQTLDYAPQSKLAGPTAKLLCELTGMDRASFCNTGSEAVLAAMRIARTVSGNDIIVTFSGDYHGMFDEVLVKTKNVGGKRKNMPVAPGIPASASNNILVLDYGDPASLEIIRQHADKLAAVLVEPIQSRTPELQPREFIQQLRTITREAGIPMIFDEIITGFRLHPKGAQAWYDVEADICCYGKVVGGGMPIGVVAGKAEYMDALDGGPWQYGDDSFPEAGVTYFAGTFIRHPLAIAAVNAVMLKLKHDGPALQENLSRRTAIFAEEVNRHFHRLGVPVEITYFGSVILPRFYGNPDFEGLFYHHLRFNGIHIWEGRPGFLTTAHTDQDMQTMVDGFVKAAQTLIEKGFFPEAGGRQPENYPWTAPQREIWAVLNHGDAAIGAYNEQIIFEIEAPIDHRVLELTLDKVVNRHASLRSVVQQNESGIAVLPYMSPALNFHDVSELDGAELEQAVDKLVRANIDLPFDFKAGPLVRFSVIQQASNNNLLCMSVSHLVCDGWSMEVVMQDIAHYYSAMLQARQVDRGTPPTLQALGTLEQEMEDTGSRQEACDYWRGVYSTLPENLELPLDHARPRIKTYAGDRLALQLDPQLNEQLRALAKQQNCTLFVVLLAAYYILLHKLSQSDDIVVGIPAAGHPSVGMTDMVTHMVSFLAVRKHVDANQSIGTFLHDLRNQFNDAREYQNLVYGDLVNMLKVPRDPGRMPLVSASFNMDLEMAPLWFAGTQAKFVTTPRSFVKYELFFNLIDQDTSIALEVDHNTDLFSRPTVLRWIDFYQQILGEIARTPAPTPIADLQLLSEHAQQSTRTDWNQTAVDYPLASSTLMSLFEQAVDQYSDNIALVCGDQQLSYAQLEQGANQVAHALHSRGVGPGQIVPILMERSIEMLVGLYGILKAGAAYLPLDPDFPQQRLHFIVQQSGATHAVCQPQFSAKLPDSVESLVLDKSFSAVSNLPSARLDAGATADDLAYVIYTSGSTGEPKGVMIEQRAICNRLLWMADSLALDASARVLQKTPYTFDVSVWELFLPLQHGARLVMAEPEGHKSPAYLVDAIEQYGITLAHFVPSMLHVFLGERDVERCRDLKQLICSGEALTRTLQDACHSKLPQTQLYNYYGPTEAAVDVSFWHCDPQDSGESVPIGRPIANTQLYVLDEAMHVQPAGVSGELYIGGVQLARGYLHRDDLTAQAFIADPFSKSPTARLYRTGDRVRQRTDGAIEYIGRTDNQVKVRGLRIELGEIDAALEQHPSIDRAVTVVREDRNHDQRLIAYLSYVQGASLDNAQLRRHLRQMLPRYMVPQQFVEMAYLPLTSSGKVDRNALPESLQVAEHAQQLIVPTTPTEQTIASICQDLLQVAQVGTEQNFFDIGGHSLLGLELIQKIEAACGIRLTPLDIMLNSLGQLAAQIDQHRTHDSGKEAAPESSNSVEAGLMKRLFNKKGVK